MESDLCSRAFRAQRALARAPRAQNPEAAPSPPLPQLRGNPGEGAPNLGESTSCAGETPAGKERSPAPNGRRRRAARERFPFPAGVLASTGRLLTECARAFASTGEPPPDVRRALAPRGGAFAFRVRAFPSRGRALRKRGRGLSPEGECSPFRGKCSPSVGECSHPRGKRSHPGGECSSPKGGCSPPGGECSRSRGETLPLPGECSPLRGECSRNRGECSPSRGETLGLSGGDLGGLAGLQRGAPAYTATISTKSPIARKSSGLRV